MKKFFSYLGALSLLMISFIISEQTALVVKETDEIMVKIKEESIKYKREPINAIIENNTIIPGLNGKKVNINKSYNEMKKIGTFNSEYFIYDEIKPQKTIKNTYDKYIISGNKKKNMISLVFLVNDNDNINSIIKTVEKHNIKVTFFIDNKWLKKNNDLTLNLIEQGHTVGYLSYNNDYEHIDILSINNILKKIEGQKNNYCYAEEENEQNLQVCIKQKNYTIKPNIIANINPLQEIKQQIKSGSIISMKINERTNNELELIIKYIKSKGFLLVNINENLSEKNNN